MKDKGFVSAEALWIGAELIDKNGNTLYVEQIYHEKLDNQFKTVYNFKVEDYHTYFVGNNSVLVHNADYVINKSGNIEITDWEGYPENMPKPEGEMSLIKGEKYVNARKAANNENAKIHRNNPQYKGKQIHEIKPVKFNGSPIDHDNKIVLTRREHAKLTTFWKRLQLQIDKDSAINKKS